MAKVGAHHFHARTRKWPGCMSPADIAHITRRLREKPPPTYRQIGAELNPPRHRNTICEFARQRGLMIVGDREAPKLQAGKWPRNPDDPANRFDGQRMHAGAEADRIHRWRPQRIGPVSDGGASSAYTMEMAA